jgi:uncharacterized protein
MSLNRLVADPRPPATRETRPQSAVPLVRAAARRPMGQAFLDLARPGRNGWWRYAVGLLLILFCWLIVGSVLSFIPPLVSALNNGSATLAIDPQTGSFAGASRFSRYLGLSLSFITFLIGILLAVRWIHGRPIRTLVTALARVRWGRIALAFALWSGLMALAALVEALLYPGRYEFALEPARFLPAALLILVLTPIQTTTEELFFRGYLLQGLGLLRRNPLFLTLTSAFIFMVPHLANPEVTASLPLLALNYFGWGVLFTILTLRDDGLELAIGVHAANNLFAALIANYTVSVLETDSIWVIKVLDPVLANVVLAVAGVVFYLLVFRWRARRVPPTDRPV